MALVLAGALVFGGISLGVQPAIRIAYVYGGLLFFTYPLLASLFAPMALVVTAHMSRLRAAPVLVVATVFVIGLAGAGVSRAGFAWVQPESFLAEEIAKDPTSPIAVAHEMARKNGTTPGAFNPIFVGLALLAALVMVAVDARGWPVLASVAYSLTVFITVSATLARMPAFAQSLPSVSEIALAAAVTVLAGLAGGVLASGAVERLQRVLAMDRRLIAARRVSYHAVDRVTCGAWGPRLVSLKARCHSRRVGGRMQCPRCQHENLPGSKFCLECGAKLDARCPACGSGNPPGHKFCHECGMTLGAGASQVKSSPDIERTEGNPFFVEESVRSLVETGILVGERGAYRLTRVVQGLQVPATAQAMLAARIDRLNPADKRLLQAAAVIGNDVPMPLLLAIADAPEPEVRAELTRLQAAEFLYETRLFPDLEYTFKHALTHEVAYGGLLHDRQRALHARITEAIERLSAERLTEQAERLAHHALRGELWEKAVTYLRQAGLRAMARAASREAIAHLEQALGALRRLPETRETTELTIDLRIDLRNAILRSAIGRA